MAPWLNRHSFRTGAYGIHAMMKNGVMTLHVLRIIYCWLIRIGTIAGHPIGSIDPSLNQSRQGVSTEIESLRIWMVRCRAECWSHSLNAQQQPLTKERSVGY